MRKYLLIIRRTYLQYVAYRVNFFLWRLRAILSILMTYFLWNAAYRGNDVAFGYGKSTMLTYIMLLMFVQGVILSTQTFSIAEEIRSGTLAQYLIRPIHYLGITIARDVSDKILNTGFSIVEMCVLFLLLRPPVFLQTNLWILGGFILSIAFGVYLYFAISSLLSFIGFWSRETWAPRFMFSIIVAFLAGGYFPLDILPRLIYIPLMGTPFPYLLYFPIRIYLGLADSGQLIYGFAVMGLWCLMLTLFMRAVWRKGLQAYTAEGF
jgi:ABC-2 type transport system permease protein